MHAALSHPNICPLYGAFETPAGDLVLILRYASLGNITEHLKHLHGTASEPYAVARLMQPVVHALEYLHAHGIAHRDVKEENIVVDGETGNAMLIDFGLAVTSPWPLAAADTLGTPPYMVCLLLMLCRAVPSLVSLLLAVRLPLQPLDMRWISSWRASER